jgi:hypothetical protein
MAWSGLPVSSAAMATHVDQSLEACMANLERSISIVHWRYVCSVQAGDQHHHNIVSYLQGHVTECQTDHVHTYHPVSLYFWFSSRLQQFSGRAFTIGNHVRSGHATLLMQRC